MNLMPFETGGISFRELLQCSCFKDIKQSLKVAHYNCNCFANFSTTANFLTQFVSLSYDKLINHCVLLQIKISGFILSERYGCGCCFQYYLTIIILVIEILKDS